MSELRYLRTIPYKSLPKELGRAEGFDIKEPCRESATYSGPFDRDTIERWVARARAEHAQGVFDWEVITSDELPDHVMPTAQRNGRGMKVNALSQRVAIKS